MLLSSKNLRRSDAFPDISKQFKNQPATKISKENRLKSASCVEIRFMKATSSLNQRFKGNSHDAELYVEVIRKDIEKGISFVQLIPLPFKGYPHSKERFDMEAISNLSPLREVEDPCITVLFHGLVEQYGKKVDLHIPMPALKGELQLRLNPQGNIELSRTPAGLDLKVETFGDFENTAKSKLRQCDITAKVVSNKNSLKVSELFRVNAVQFNNVSEIVLEKKAAIACNQSIINDKTGKIVFNGQGIFSIKAPIMDSNGILQGTEQGRLKIEGEVVSHIGDEARITSFLGTHIQGDNIKLLSAISSTENLLITHSGGISKKPEFKIVVSEISGSVEYKITYPGENEKPCAVVFSEKSLRSNEQVNIEIPIQSDLLGFTLNSTGDVILQDAPLDLNLELKTFGNFTNKTKVFCSAEKAILGLKTKIENQAGSIITAQECVSLLCANVILEGGQSTAQVEEFFKESQEGGMLGGKPLKLVAEYTIENKGILLGGSLQLTALDAANGTLKNDREALIVSDKTMNIDVLNIYNAEEAKIVSAKTLTLNITEVKNFGTIWGGTLEIQVKNIHNFVGAKMGSAQTMLVRSEVIYNAGEMQARKFIPHDLNVFENSQSGIVRVVESLILKGGTIQNSGVMQSSKDVELHASRVEQHGTLICDGDIHINAQTFSHTGRIKAKRNVIIHADNIQSLGEIEVDGDIEIHYGSGEFEIADKLKAKGKVRFVLREGRDITQSFNHMVGGLQYELLPTATKSLKFLVDQKVPGNFKVIQSMAFVLGSPSQYLSLFSEQGAVEIQAAGIYGVNGRVAGMKGVILKSAGKLQLGIPLYSTAEDPMVFAQRQASFFHHGLGKKGRVGKQVGVYRHPELKWQRPLCYSVSVMSGGDIFLEGTNLLWNHLELVGLKHLRVRGDALLDIASSVTIHENASFAVPNIQTEVLVEVENLRGQAVPIRWDSADYAERRLYERKSVITRPAFWSIAGKLECTGQMTLLGSQVCCSAFEGSTPFLLSVYPYLTYASYGLFSIRKNPWWLVTEEIAPGTPVKSIFNPNVLSESSPALMVDGIISSTSIVSKDIQTGHIGAMVDFSLPAPRSFRSYIPLIDFAQDSRLFEITEIGTNPTVYQPVLPFQFAGLMGPILVVTPKGLKPNVHHRRCFFTPLQEKEYLERAFMEEFNRKWLGSNISEPHQALKLLQDNAERYTQAIISSDGMAIVPRNANMTDPMIVYEEVPFIHQSGRTEVCLFPALCVPKAFDNPRLRDWAGGLFASNGIFLTGASRHDSTLNITGHVNTQGQLTFSTFQKLEHQTRMTKTVQRVCDTVKQKSLGGLVHKTKHTEREVEIWKRELGNTVTASTVTYENIDHLRLAGLTIHAGRGGVETKNVNVIEQRALLETGITTNVTRNRGLISGSATIIQEQTYHLVSTDIHSPGLVHLDAKMICLDNLVVNGEPIIDGSLALTSSVNPHSSDVMTTNHSNTLNHQNTQISAERLIIGETPKRLAAEKREYEAAKREAQRTAKRKQKQADIRFLISLPVSYYTAGVVGGFTGATGVTLVVLKGASMGFTGSLIRGTNPLVGAGESVLFSMVGFGVGQIPFFPTAPQLLQEVVQEVVTGVATGALQTALHGGHLVENMVTGAIVNGVAALVMPNPHFGTTQQMPVAIAVARALVQAGVGTLLSGSEQRLIVNLASSAMGASMGRILSAKGEEHGRQLANREPMAKQIPSTSSRSKQNRHLGSSRFHHSTDPGHRTKSRVLDNAQAGQRIDKALESAVQQTVHLLASSDILVSKSEVRQAFAKHPALQDSGKKMQENLIALGKADGFVRDNGSAFARGCEKVF